jgi:Site-specific DNA methylase
MGHGFRLCEKCGWKKDVYAREAAYAVRYWNDLPAVITNVAHRLKMVQIEHKPAVELIKAFNHDNVLIYADPPYVLSTRSRKQYRHEMTDQDHVELLETLLQHTGPVMLSGYDNEIYNTYLSGWRKESIPARAENSLPRIECLWMNY